MSKELVARVKADLAEVRQKLAELGPLKQREEQLMAVLPALLALYAPDEPAEAAPPAAEPSLELRRRPMTHGGGVASQLRSMKERVLDAAAKVYLTDGAMKSRDMVPKIEAMGITISGADKLATLSSILSKSDDFVSDRIEGGWKYVPRQKEQPPQDEPTSAGASVV